MMLLEKPVPCGSWMLVSLMHVEQTVPMCVSKERLHTIQPSAKRMASFAISSTSPPAPLYDGRMAIMSCRAFHKIDIFSLSSISIAAENLAYLLWREVEVEK